MKQSVVVQNESQWNWLIVDIIHVILVMMIVGVTSLQLGVCDVPGCMCCEVLWQKSKVIAHDLLICVTYNSQAHNAYKHPQSS